MHLFTCMCKCTLVIVIIKQLVEHYLSGSGSPSTVASHILPSTRTGTRKAAHVCVRARVYECTCWPIEFQLNK